MAGDGGGLWRQNKTKSRPIIRMKHTFNSMLRIHGNRKASCPSALATRYAPTCRPTPRVSTRNRCAPVRDPTVALWFGTARMDIQSLKDQTSTRCHHYSFCISVYPFQFQCLIRPSMSTPLHQDYTHHPPVVLA